MRCKRVKKYLLLLVDNPGEIKPEVAAHLSSCASCRREFAFLQKITSALRSGERVQAPAGFPAGVMARIAAEVPVAGQRWTVRLRLKGWKQLVAAAATLLLIAGSTFAMVLSGRSSTPHVATKAPTGVVVSPVNRTENRQPAVDAPPDPGTSPQKPVNSGSDTVMPAKTDKTAAPEDNKPVTKPKTSEQPPQVTEVRPPVVFLSRQRILTSTQLRIQVRDIDAATVNALATAHSWGADHKCTVPASEGGPRVQILQFTIDKDNSDGFLIVLSGLGTVIDRHDDAVDYTESFNKQKAEYERLVAARNQASEEESVTIDAKLNELEKRLAELDALAGIHTVTLCLTE
ncbi:MAG: hypothetical protein AB1426_10415 [Bacillota bacterium]